MTSLWQKCLDYLLNEYPEEFNTWLRPLYPVVQDNNSLLLLAPNRFVMDWVRQHYWTRINELVDMLSDGQLLTIELGIGSRQSVNAKNETVSNILTGSFGKTSEYEGLIAQPAAKPILKSNLLTKFTFDNFIEGHSNQLALAAALQVVENPGQAYNPLYVYGAAGLGKTHLMQAIGNEIGKKHPEKRVLYISAERFVAEMVRALQTNSSQNNAFDEFKKFYRSIEVLFIDDIQFFAGKERSQEELFHTFNALFEEQRQIVLSCDRYPKEIDDLSDRLKSRFGWGLTVAIEPPELETRVAILISKARENHHLALSEDVAFFIAKRIRSNVRELEGALKRVVASAHFTGKAVTVEFARDALKDLLAVQDKLITIENIMKMTASYFKIKIADLLSKRRNRSVAYPRQMAMALAKELTNHSLPEIGDAFGGRDHTTVIHACRKIKGLVSQNSSAAEDYKNLLRILTA